MSRGKKKEPKTITNDSRNQLLEIPVFFFLLLYRRASCLFTQTHMHARPFSPMPIAPRLASSSVLVIAAFRVNHFEQKQKRIDIPRPHVARRQTPGFPPSTL